MLDPYAGHGASAIAALANGHRWIGVEVDERHCEAIVDRLSQAALDFDEVGA